jgi:hypothetical protein
MSTYKTITSKTITSNFAPLSSTISSGTSSTSSTSSSTSTSISTSSVVKIILVIVLLAYFGINIFQYLANTTTHIARTTEWIVEYLGWKTVSTAKEAGKLAETTAETSLKGLKYGLDTTIGRSMEDLDRTLAASLERNNRERENKRSREQREKRNDPSYTHAAQQQVQHSTQLKNLNHGYCYIGEDRGHRSCARIGRNDICMSEEIYPTIDVCINPKLRV